MPPHARHICKSVRLHSCQQTHVSVGGNTLYGRLSLYCSLLFSQSAGTPSICLGSSGTLQGMMGAVGRLGNKQGSAAL